MLCERRIEIFLLQYLHWISGYKFLFKDVQQQFSEIKTLVLEICTYEKRVELVNKVFF